MVVITTLSLIACIEVLEYETLPTQIIVVKQSDNTPVANILIRVRYNYENMMFTWKINKPLDAEGKTGELGSVILPVADFRKGVDIQIGTHPETPFWGTAYLLLSRDQLRTGGEFSPHGYLVKEKPDTKLKVIVKRPAAS